MITIETDLNNSDNNLNKSGMFLIFSNLNGKTPK